MYKKGSDIKSKGNCLTNSYKNGIEIIDTFSLDVKNTVRQVAIICGTEVGLYDYRVNQKDNFKNIKI